MINHNGILTILKWQCIRCNIYEEIGKGTRCTDCPFCKSSSPKKGSPSRIGLKYSIFKNYGLSKKQCQNNGKSQLFMYLCYPYLNWSPPEIPDYDNYGNPVNKETAKISLHHIDGDHNNDSEDNLTWRLQSDHNRDEQANRKMKKFIKEKTKCCAKKLGIKVD